MIHRHLLACAAALVCSATAEAEVTLPSVLGDHMVLQQQTEAPIWGWARVGEAVTVEGSWGERVEAVADARGRWVAHLPTPVAGGPHEVIVRGATGQTALNDVMIGEVWLCSGQSNMEMPVGNVGPGYGGVENAQAEIADARNPDIRLFTVENTRSVPPRANCRGAWARCDSDTVHDFSATAYFFGRELQRRLQVPVGLISADWGGTVAQAWMSESALSDFPVFAPDLAFLEQMADPARRMNIVEDRVERWWSELSSSAPAGWTEGAVDAGWAPTTLPATFQGDLAAFDGVVFFQRTVELPGEWAGAAATLELGPIDDYDDVWINGVHVGATHQPNRWAEARRYTVQGGVLRDGANVISVRVLDTGGLGGINGSEEQLMLRRGESGPSIPLAGAWQYAQGPSVARLPRKPQGAAIDQNMPTVLFNGMIAPLRPMRLGGVIWYQGESNRSDPAQYGQLFPALIDDWRRQFQRTDLPFYFVQIAPYRYRGDTGQTAELREAQLQTLSVPHTGMAVTMDIGDRNDIHPKNKQAVGARLARWALAETYQQANIVPSGPIYRSMEVQGKAIRIRFDHIGGGLVHEPTGTGQFAIAGADQRFVPAEVRVQGKTLLVSSPDVPRPTAVRYGWRDTAVASLFNAQGLPASPFRTDGWSGPLPPMDNDAEMVGYRSDEPGFVDCFNGRDLSGWQIVNGAPSTWKVRDDVVECSGIPTGVLRTEQQYENFILELEWRHLQPLGNAGVFIWSDPLPARGQPYTRGIEVQVLDGQEGDWYTSDGDIFPIHGAVMTPENDRGGSRAFPTEARSNPSPLWNHYRITAIDGTVTLAVNGKVVTRGARCRPRKGYICLESEGSPVEFRNVRLKPLPDGPTLAAEEVAQPAQPWSCLYNGVDFDGWAHGPEHAGHWRAADWRMDFDGVGSDLWTQRSYRDFTLICDWRWTGDPKETPRPVILETGDVEIGPDGKEVLATVPDAGDSGIYLRGSSKSQVNIWCWPCGSGEVYGYRTDQSLPLPVRAAVTPSAVADAPIGEWNRFQITLIGDRLTVVLNGQTVIEEAQLPGIPESGPIALQKHGSAIQFANIYLLER